MFVELTYRDGSANAYHFHATGEWTYVPVRPEQSSTGMYAGGDPRSGRLDASALADVWRRVTALAEHTALHVPDRGKGTGQFVITTADGERTFIVARGADLAAFDAYLGALR